MRKHSVRKWLHAILDLLPLFVIPVFAIYSRNENAQFGYEVTQEVNKAVDFNQLIQNGNFDNGTTNFNANGSSLISANNNVCTIDNNGYTYPGIAWTEILTLNQKYLLSCDINAEKYIRGNANGNQIYVSDTNTNNTFVKAQVIFELSSRSNNNFILFTATGYDFEVTNIMLFNLTQMNMEDVTIAQFNDYFNSVYYPYTESQELVIENYETITYNDTDIGSQMIYTLYNTVNKYFNMNNVFNMGAIWNWVNNTMFGGSAPLSAYIVYQIIAYELIMDIIFLLYSVMMFIVDFAEKGIDRFMGRAS